MNHVVSGQTLVNIQQIIIVQKLVRNLWDPAALPNCEAELSSCINGTIDMESGAASHIEVPLVSFQFTAEKPDDNLGSHTG